MHIQISINTTEPTAEDANILTALATALGGKTPAAAPDKGEPEDAPAVRKASKPKPKHKPTPEPAPEPEDEPAEDEPVTAEDESGETMEAAVEAATKVMSEPGGGKKVKTVLADLGAKRVSELKPGQIGEFITALDA